MLDTGYQILDPVCWFLDTQSKAFMLNLIAFFVG